MSISILLEMAASTDPDRIAVVEGDHRWTTAQLNRTALAGAALIAESGAAQVVYIGTGGIHLPALIFAAAYAARPLTPINYRLSADAISELVRRLPEPLVIADSRYQDALADSAAPVLDSAEFLAAAPAGGAPRQTADPADAAIVLFTSGTTSQPKAVELSHNNLTSYVTSTVEFQSSDARDAALVCVPPYHIAGVSAVLSNIYGGRKIVYMAEFDAREWVRLIRSESVTTATVVPTMLDRIVAVLQDEPAELPTLRNLAYGGSKVAAPLVRKAIDLFPGVGLVNAYGLTETSSTIAVLTPEDHQMAHTATDDAIAARLGSVGRPIPGVEVQIRDETGQVVGPGESGELYVRGEQISGKYTGIGSVLDADGWFATRDLASRDRDGYLFIKGRADDTIIRGGENIAPAEIEDVLVEHPDVHDVAVVGVEDPHWGQAIVVVVVAVTGTRPDADELRQYVRQRLRGSRTPDRIVFVDELPTNATGKVLRRQLVNDLRTS